MVRMENKPESAVVAGRLYRRKHFFFCFFSFFGSHVLESPLPSVPPTCFLLKNRPVIHSAAFLFYFFHSAHFHVSDLPFYHKIVNETTPRKILLIAKQPARLNNYPGRDYLTK